MERILACVDSSAYAAPVCDLAAWAATRFAMPVELLHVVQRTGAAAARHDLSGTIGLGVKGDLLEELTRLDETDARLQIERGRLLIKAGEERLAAAGVAGVEVTHRHGGIVETILEREANARVIVMGKRGASHGFATEHIGSKIERVLRASTRPMLVASREIEPPRSIVLAWDGSPAARRALGRCANSPLLAGLPVEVVSAGPEDGERRALVAEAAAKLAGREVRTTIRPGRPDEAIASVVAGTPGALLVMGAYGHSPLRTLIVGSTTTALIRTVRTPVLLVR